MWKFINTGYSRGAFNMFHDEQLVRNFITEGNEGVVRVYGWDPPCISVGYHQSFNSLDLEKCRREGIDVVRRPTGGRAVLHWNELTYSVVTRCNGESLMEVYHSIGRALERSLQMLNREIELAAPDVAGERLELPSSNIPCYASIARFEIQYRGKKLVGSAQRRYRFPQDDGRASGGPLEEVLLQHGSILLGQEHRRIAEFIASANEEAIPVLKRRLETKSTELSTILGRPVALGEVAECLKRGFEAEWGIQFSGASKEESYSWEENVDFNP